MKKENEIVFKRDKNGHVSRSQSRVPVHQLVEAIESGVYSFEQARERYGIKQETLVNWMRLYSSNPNYHSGRYFTKEQKQQILLEAEQPGVTVISVCRKYQISPNTIEKWRKKYCFAGSSNQAIRPGMEINTAQINELNGTIRELKLKVLALETMIEIAERECNYPIRKKCGTKQ
jgi:transposase